MAISRWTRGGTGPVLVASTATLGHLLKPIRSTAGSRRRGPRKRSLGKHVPVRTYNDWNGPPPGYLEINLSDHAASAVAVMAGGIGIGTAIVGAGRAAEAGQLGEKAGAVVLLAAVGVGLTALAVALIRKRLTR